MKRLRLSVAVAIHCVLAARADVRLPSFFSDHMVLQSGAPSVWGSAGAGEEVEVEFLGRTARAKAGADGRWKVKLERLVAGEKGTLRVSGVNRLRCADVLVGDVWLASGQSNMTMPVKQAKDAEMEQKGASFPQIRMFTVLAGIAAAPQEECKGKWTVCSPEGVGEFSAVAYYFARSLHQSLGVPIGIIHSSVPATSIEAWTSLEAQRERTELTGVFERWSAKQAAWRPEPALAAYEEKLAVWKKAAAAAKLAGKPTPWAPMKPLEPRLDFNYPGNLFNSKIAPLIPITLRGVIWYQGENHAAHEPLLYGMQLRLMIADWRRRWNSELPFLWVQLPEFRKLQTLPVEKSGWAEVRQQMLETLSVPKTGMAVALGTGESNELHPKNKQEVGRRLALSALSTVYGKPGPVSPTFRDALVKEGTIEIRFQPANAGLKTMGDPALKGFAISDASRSWVWAQARIEGDSVIVSHPAMARPVAVRYGWADHPAGNLFSRDGLPASPFRTDAWTDEAPVSTQ